MDQLEGGGGYGIKKAGFSFFLLFFSSVFFFVVQLIEESLPRRLSDVPPCDRGFPQQHARG